MLRFANEDQVRHPTPPLVRLRLFPRRARHRRFVGRPCHWYPSSRICRLLRLALPRPRGRALRPSYPGRHHHRGIQKAQRPTDRRRGRSPWPVDLSRRGTHSKLEELPGRVRPLPPLRYLEAAARAATGSPSRRARHQPRRRHGGRIRRTCVIRSRVVQSLLNMPLRKPADSKPLISQVTPPAAIAGGELQIRGKGFAQEERPKVTIGEVGAPVIIGSDSFVIARVPEGATAGELVIA